MLNSNKRAFCCHQIELFFSKNFFLFVFCTEWLYKYYLNYKLQCPLPNRGFIWMIIGVSFNHLKNTCVYYKKWQTSLFSAMFLTILHTHKQTNKKTIRPKLCFSCKTPQRWRGIQSLSVTRLAINPTLSPLNATL